METDRLSQGWGGAGGGNRHHSLSERKPPPGAGSGAAHPSHRSRPRPQLWPDWRYHALATNTGLSAVAADAFYRAHARVELAIRDIKAHAGLSHCPSGNFFANAAWLACATLAHNLYRWIEQHTRPAGRLTNAKHCPHPTVQTARKNRQPRTKTDPMAMGQHLPLILIGAPRPGRV